MRKIKVVFRFHINLKCCCYHSVILLCPVLWPHGLQHPRLPCTSPSPGVCPSSCSLHCWCHPAISSSDTLFSFCPWSFPASRTFPMSHLFTSDRQNNGASASASVLLVNIQGWSPSRWTSLISLLSKGLSGVFSSTTIWRHWFFGVLPSLQPSSQVYMFIRKERYSDTISKLARSKQK